MNDLFHDENMRQERLKLMERARKGGSCCPMCDQFAKVYTRSLNAKMAALLIQAYKKFGAHDFHITELEGASASGGEFARLRYWKLIEEKLNTDDSKRTSGVWRVTMRGFDFVHRLLRVQKYVLLYNGNLMGFEGDFVTIEDCLQDKFDYKVLMEN